MWTHQNCHQFFSCRIIPWPCPPNGLPLLLRNTEDFWSSIRSFKVRDNSFGDVERFSGGLDTASEIMYHYHPKLCLQMISSGSGTLFWQVPALKQETNVTALLERCKKKQVRQFFPVFSGTLNFLPIFWRCQMHQVHVPSHHPQPLQTPRCGGGPRTRPARCALLAASSAATQRPWICRSLEVCTFTKVEVSQFYNGVKSAPPQKSCNMHIYIYLYQFAHMSFNELNIVVQVTGKSGC